MPFIAKTKCARRIGFVPLAALACTLTVSTAVSQDRGGQQLGLVGQGAARTATLACPAPPPRAAASAHRQPSNALAYRPFPATWQAALDSFVKQKIVPGAVVIVKSPIWGVRVGAAGLSDLGTSTRMSPGEQFRVGSVTKVFTAQAVLSLEQEGRLKLTDRVPKYLGDDPVVMAIPDIDKVTIEDLLQMKSGITNYLTDKILTSVRTNPAIHYSPDDLMAVLGKTAQPPLNPDFAPGATYPDPYWVAVFQKQVPEPAPYHYWYYSNSNYILLGMIMEKITGLPAGDVIQHYVMDRADLADTYFAGEGRRLPAMHGYTEYDALMQKKVYDDWCDVTATNPSYAWTAGAVVSTPWDLLHFLETMFQTQRLLNEGTKEKWLTFVSADIHLGWASMEYGVGGLMQPHRAYGDFRGHGGAYPGYKTLIYYFPDSQTSFVLASNTWDQTGADGPEVAILDTIMPLVKSAATTPRPGNDGAARLNENGTIALAWQAGRIYGDSYDVFVGTDPDKVDTATAAAHADVRLERVSGTHLDIGGLAQNRTYYWRVDTIAGNRSITGPLWRFGTQE